jgi:hypothetical protein
MEASNQVDRCRSGTSGCGDASRYGRICALTAAGIAAVAVNLLQACGFEGYSDAPLKTPAEVYALLNDAPFTTPSASDRWTVTEEAGRIKVEHGWSCADLAHAATKEQLGAGILETARLPDGFAGTVFLNGWSLEYANGDHNVLGLGSAIFNVYQVGNQLLWNAGGMISDENGDDPFRWCYRYTILAWPKGSSQVDIDAVHSEPSGKLMFVDAEQGSSQGVLHSIPGSYRSKGKRPQKRKPPRGRLLAGFGVVWADDDHDVLQIGFDLGPASISGRRIDWISKTILKENAASCRFRSADIVTILRGGSVRFWQPQTVVLESGSGTPGPKPNAWTLAPRATSPCPNVGAGAGRVYHFAIDDLPYRWAVPMLTGWDVGDVCNDNNVERVGAWIEDFDYAPPAGGQPGKLYYTVRTLLADEDDFPGMRDQVKVGVLGVELLRGTGGVVPIPVPFEPPAQP